GGLRLDQARRRLAKRGREVRRDLFGADAVALAQKRLREHLQLGGLIESLHGERECEIERMFVGAGQPAKTQAATNGLGAQLDSSSNASREFSPAQRSHGLDILMRRLSRGDIKERDP